MLEIQTETDQWPFDKELLGNVMEIHSWEQPDSQSVSYQRSFIHTSRTNSKVILLPHVHCLALFSQSTHHMNTE